MAQADTDKRSWLRHPLASVIVGFLLTGVLGTAVTQNFLDRREREKLRSQATAERKEVLKKFSELVLARQTQALLLIEGVENNAPKKDLEKRKSDYDEAYKDWSIKLSGVMLLARDLLGPAKYAELEKNVEVRLRQNSFIPTRRCLRKLFTQMGDNQAALETIQRCDAKKMIEKSSACSHAIINGLYELTALETESVPGTNEKEKLAAARKRIEESCP